MLLKGLLMGLLSINYALDVELAKREKIQPCLDSFFFAHVSTRK